MAKFPDQTKLPSRPVTEERDAVRRALNYFKANNLETLPWGQFQRQLQSLAQRFPSLWATIRQNGPVEKVVLEKWLARPGYSDSFDITYDTYHKPTKSYRDIEQTVVQINATEDVANELARDPALEKLFRFISDNAPQAGHPSGHNGVGWLRVDYIESEDLLYVDEIQSDIVNQTQSFMSFLQTNSPEEWWERQNPALQAQIERDYGRQSVGANWNGVRGALRSMGVDLAKLEEAKKKFAEMFANWVEFAIATIIEVAASHGIKRVAIASSDAILIRDPSVGKEKLRMFYDKMAKRFGFEEQTINVPELRGTKVWVRQASRKFTH